MFLPWAMLVLGVTAHAEEIPGQQLLSYFQANCRGQGEWTRAALADSTALLETLRGIQDDPDCRTVGGSIAGLGLVNQQLQNLQNISGVQEQIAAYDSQEQELLVQLSLASTPAVQDEINAQLREIQLNRAGLLGRERAQQELATPAKAELMMGLLQLANTTYGQLAANQRCLTKNPGVLNAATAVMSSVGAAATFVNPALGLGLTAASSLLGSTVEGFRQRSNAVMLRGIADNSIAQEGFKCALETMNDRWCRMRDAESFLRFKAEQRQRRPLDQGLASAIRLNDRDIPVLMDWLNRIRGGVVPDNTGAANRQATVFQREFMVRTFEGYGLSIIAQNRSIYGNTPDDERWNFIKTIITRIVPSLSSPESPSHPMLDVKTYAYAPYYLMGFGENDPRIRLSDAEGGGFKPFDSFAQPNNFPLPDLDSVKGKFESWIRQARERVNSELMEVLQPDALQTLSSAYDRTNNSQRVSAMDALVAISTFLEAHPPSDVDRAFSRIYADTIASLREIHRITEDAVLVSRQDATAVRQIYVLAQLQFGTVVLQTRLDMIVRLSLIELLRVSPPEDQVLVAQILAAERFTDMLTRMSGTDNLAQIRQDIQRAQPITISNLNSFVRVFGPNLNRILLRLRNEENRADATVARAKRNARTELCFLLLGVPDARFHVAPGYCEGLRLEPLVEGAPASLTITRRTFARDFEERACVYRDYFRANRIFENWGISSR